MTPFERFFAEDFQKLLAECLIPDRAWTTPPANPRSPRDVSWDRRAAWLLFATLNGEDVTRPAPEPDDPYDGY